MGTSFCANFDDSEAYHFKRGKINRILSGYQFITYIPFVSLKRNIEYDNCDYRSIKEESNGLINYIEQTRDHSLKERDYILLGIENQIEDHFCDDVNDEDFNNEDINDEDSSFKCYENIKLLPDFSKVVIKLEEHIANILDDLFET